MRAFLRSLVKKAQSKSRSTSAKSTPSPPSPAVSPPPDQPPVPSFSPPNHRYRRMDDTKEIENVDEFVGKGSDEYRDDGERGYGRTGAVGRLGFLESAKSSDEDARKDHSPPKNGKVSPTQTGKGGETSVAIPDGPAQDRKERLYLEYERRISRLEAVEKEMKTLTKEYHARIRPLEEERQDLRSEKVRLEEEIWEGKT